MILEKGVSKTQCDSSLTLASVVNTLKGTHMKMNRSIIKMISRVNGKRNALNTSQDIMRIRIEVMAQDLLVMEARLKPSMNLKEGKMILINNFMEKNSLRIQKDVIGWIEMSIISAHNKAVTLGILLKIDMEAHQETMVKESLQETLKARGINKDLRWTNSRDPLWIKIIKLTIKINALKDLFHSRAKMNSACNLGLRNITDNRLHKATKE